MAKASTKEKEESNVLSPEKQAEAFFNANKGSHYNYEESHDYKVKSSSLLLTSHMNGGLNPGAHRFMGVSESGKTSCALDFMYHFLQEERKKRRGIYVKSEGRLSENVKARSGIDFIYHPKDWADGTCLVVEANEYEFIFDFVNNLVKNNETGTEYFIIMDSMDTMIKKNDMLKGTADALQVAGGAVLTSTFLKKASLALSKRGHVCVFISQYRETISQDRGPVAPRQGNASGGHAMEHGADWAFEFLKPRAGKDGDVIRETEAIDAKPIGHWCRMKTHKSPNEKSNITITYPVKYGRTGAKSVWLERELADLLLAWGWVEKKGAWLAFDAAKLKEINEATKVEVPEKIQGLNNLYDFLENNPAVTSFLFDKFVEVIS